MTAQVAADLRAAAEVLRRDGWTQGVNEAADGCKCLMGAMAYVASDGKTSSDGSLYGGIEKGLSRLKAMDRALVPIIGVGLTTWNDEAAESADEVIAALEAAADAAEQQA